MDTSKLFVIDIGGDRLRAGLSTEGAPSVNVANAVGKLLRQGKVFKGRELSNTGVSGRSVELLRPVERGFVTDWEMQAELLRHSIPGLPASRKAPPSVAAAARRGKAAYHSVAKQATTGGLAILVQAPFAPPTLEAAAMAALFGECGFAGVVRCSANRLAGLDAASAPPSDRSVPPGIRSGTGIVVDIGFSASVVVPYVGGRALPRSVKRVPVGGKLLTNHLKELLQFRQVDLGIDFPLVDHIKRTLCFVSRDYERDLHTCAFLESSRTIDLLRKWAASQCGGGRQRPSPVAVAHLAQLEAQKVARRLLAAYANGGRVQPETAEADGAAGQRATRAAQANRPDAGAAAGADDSDSEDEDFVPDEEEEEEGGVKVHVPDEMPLGMAVELSRWADCGPAVLAGTGVGLRRDYILPDKMHVPGAVGFVRGSKGDPFKHKWLAEESLEVRATVAAAEEADGAGVRLVPPELPEPSAAPDQASRPSTPSSAAAGAAGAGGRRRAGDDEGEPTAGDLAQLQMASLCVERLAVPEVLLRPRDIGLECGGIADAIEQCVRSAPPVVQPALWSSVLLTGGSARLPGLAERLRAELRRSAPQDVDVCVGVAPEPELGPWRGAVRLSRGVSGLPCKARPEEVPAAAAAVATLAARRRDISAEPDSRLLLAKVGGLPTAVPPCSELAVRTWLPAATLPWAFAGQSQQAFSESYLL